MPDNPLLEPIQNDEPSKTASSRSWLEPHGSLSFFGAIFNMSAGGLSAGMLALPSIMGKDGTVRTGYMGALVLVILSALCQRVSNSTISRTMDLTGRQCVNLGNLAQAAFGSRGHAVFSLVSGVTTLGFCTGYVILLGSTVRQVTDCDPHVGVAVMALVLSPFALCPLSDRLAAINSFCTVIIVLLIIVGAISAGSAEKWSSVGPLAQFGPGFCTIIYGMGIGLFFPAVKADMIEPEKAEAASDLAVLFITSVYTVIMVVSYYAWGDEVSANVLDSIASGPIVATSRVLLFVNIFVCYSILMRCASVGFDDLCGVGSDRSRIALRLCLAAFVGLLGVAVPCFSEFLGLIGALTVVGCNMLLPPACYWVLQLRRHGSFSDAFKKQCKFFITHLVLAFFALVAITVGTVVGWDNLLTALAKLNNHTQ